MSSGLTTGPKPVESIAISCDIAAIGSGVAAFLRWAEPSEGARMVFFLTRLKHSFLTFGWGDDASRWPFQLHSLHHFWSWECPGLHGKMIVDELYYVSQFFMGQSKHQSVNHSKLLAAPMLRRFQKPHLLAKCDLWHRSMSAWSYNDDLYKWI